MHNTFNPEGQLPHQRLVAFAVAKELLAAVYAAQIRDAELLDQATRAAKSAARFWSTHQ